MPVNQVPEPLPLSPAAITADHRTVLSLILSFSLSAQGAAEASGARLTTAAAGPTARGAGPPSVSRQIMPHLPQQTQVTNPLSLEDWQSRLSLLAERGACLHRHVCHCRVAVTRGEARAAPGESPAPGQRRPVARSELIAGK